jgi:hypothetical protein
MSRKLISAQYDFRAADKRAGAKVNGVRLYSMPDGRSEVASTFPKISATLSTPKPKSIAEHGWNFN